jgi:hypothetical protein
MINPGVLERLPDTARTEAKEELDARIAAAFTEAEDAKSVDVSRLLPEVEEATTAADAAAGEARARALDPLLSPDEVKLARREMEDAAFTRDRLCEARNKLVERIEVLKALEVDRRARVEYERVLAERDRLAEEMESMVEPIVRIAHLVGEIEFCDRQIGRRRSTIVTSQLPLSAWHDVIGDPTDADAILDRLVHNAHRIELAGESLRRARGKQAKTA